MNIDTRSNTILSANIPTGIIECMDQICSNPPRPKTTGPLPTSFDLRTRYPGLISDALAQGTCGACWAFATATAFGDRIRIFSRNGTNTTQFVEKLDGGRITSYWVETNIVSTGQPLLRDKVTINYQLYSNITVNGRRISGVVKRQVLDTLSPTYLAACDVCELPFELNSQVARYLRSQGIQCSNCCDGGIVQYAHIFMVLKGLISLSCNPEPSKFTCTDWAGCPPYRAKSVYKVSITRYDVTRQIINGRPTDVYNQRTQIAPEDLEPNMDRIMRNIIDYGTVVASMETFENFNTGSSGFAHLGNGLMLYYATQGNSTGGHAINIVGWGEVRTTDGRLVRYWICRNTWGIGWLKSIKPTNTPDTNEGFFAILRGIDFCGIERDVYAAEPFQVYDIFKPNGELNRIPENLRPPRNKYDSLPCSLRPRQDEPDDNVRFVSDCTQCKPTDSMCIQENRDGSLTLCRASRY